jgi:ankyrin repeat protein
MLKNNAFFSFLFLFLFVRCSLPDSTKYFHGQDLEIADAISKGNLDKIEQLSKQKKINLDTIGEDGMTFLLWSFKTKNKKSMQKLLELGANPNLEISRPPENIKLLKKMYPDSVITVQSSILGEVVRFMNDDFEWIDILAKYGTDLCKSKYGNEFVFSTALFYKRFDIIFYLLDKGADINCKDNFGATISIYCAKLGRYDIVYMLLQKGADLTLYSNSERGVFDYNKQNIVMKPYKDDIADIIQRAGGYDEKQLPYRKKIKDYLRIKGYKFPILEDWEIKAGVTESYENNY